MIYPLNIKEPMTLKEIHRFQWVKVIFFMIIAAWVYGLFSLIIVGMARMDQSLDLNETFHGLLIAETVLVIVGCILHKKTGMDTDNMWMLTPVNGGACKELLDLFENHSEFKAYQQKVIDQGREFYEFELDGLKRIVEQEEQELKKKEEERAKEKIYQKMV